MMNVWALVFGAFYYFAENMWFKGSFILGVSWLFCGVLMLAEGALGKEIPGIVYWIIPAGICWHLRTVG
jgi:hypothetical protein